MAKKKKEIQPDRILLPGKPNYEHCDNKVVSARYTLVTFFPVVRTYVRMYYDNTASFRCKKKGVKIFEIFFF